MNEFRNTDGTGTLGRRALLRAAGAAALQPLAAEHTHAELDAKSAVATLGRPHLVLFIADDWSRHAGVYGTSPVPTPAFDALARDGALFTNAFTPAPSCSPARAGIFTGRYPHRLGKGVNLSDPLPDAHPRYSDLLAARSGFYRTFVPLGPCDRSRVTPPQETGSSALLILLANSESALASLDPAHDRPSFTLAKP